MKAFFSKVKTTTFQQTIICIAAFYVVFLLGWQYTQNYYAEDDFKVLKVEKSVKRLASNINVGLHINNFSEFSFYKNKFVMDSIVWFQFETGTESLDDIKKFSFKSGEFVYKSDPKIKLIKDYTIVSFHVVVKFFTFLNFKHFPVSDHRLNIVLENRRMTANEMVFESDKESFTLSDNLMITNWSPVETRVSSGYLSADINSKHESVGLGYPSTAFTIDFKNVMLRDFIVLYIPLFLLFFIGFMSLVMTYDKERLMLIATSMPILVLYSLALDGMSPDFSGITKVDKTYFLLIFLSIVILALQSYVNLKIKQSKIDSTKNEKTLIKKLNKTNNIVMVAVLFALILGMSYITFF
jgi:hypothetical protein